jgi:hypothetical protein
MTRSRKANEFGDFQTPTVLTREVCQLLVDRGLTPASVVEPTCGFGNFLFSALDHFPTVVRAVGIEINQVYVEKLLAVLRNRRYVNKVLVLRESFFRADLVTLLRDLPEPILVLGNPPWVTNARLGVLGSTNLPEKTNFQNYDGLDALTGKSNFDISEWMLIKLLDLLEGRRATMVMLCKSAVARRVLVHAWKNHISLESAEIRTIDASTLFGAAVDACLLVCSLSPSRRNYNCQVFRQLRDSSPAKTIGYQDGVLSANVEAYNRWKHLNGESVYRWRSGIKHDCAKVMELRKEGNQYRNGLGELVGLEDQYLYPMLKSSELANGLTKGRNRWMLVTQRTVGDNTSIIRVQAPKTWTYLWEHSAALDRRASSIYRDRPRFSVFGVGNYSFSPWKVAISGLYKKLQFTVLGNTFGKPIVLDDTCYFIPCQTEQEAHFIASLLNSSIACEFFSAFIFWDTKRPITTDVLGRLDLVALARELGNESTMLRLWQQRNPRKSDGQMNLFDVQ